MYRHLILLHVQRRPYAKLAAMLWRILVFGIGFYLVLMFLAAIAQLKQWKGIRLICLYALTLGVGVIASSLLSLLIGHWFPRLTLPMFIVLSLSWCWFGWRHASDGVGF